jgi:mono/diheme cytochrome c family protein
MKATLIVSLALLSAAPVFAAPPSPEVIEFFEKRVRPVLAEHCFSCHGPQKQKGGLRLDSEAALLRGSESGKVVIPGDPDKSLLIRAIRHDGDAKMPPKEKLPADAIEALTAWVKMGAPWPMTDKVADDAAAWKKHWAFQPVKNPAPSAVKDTGWPGSPIDFFVLAKLEAKGWKPAREAERRTLVRRVYFDLLGLPPTPEDVDAFVNDQSADAYAKLIDRLLASPHFGERWARHWLDLARYADERGYVGVNVDRVYPYAYGYRDWVVRALNEDLPYDRFILDQLAADQIVSGPDNRDLAAMGFLTVGRRFLNNTHDIIDDRIDVVCRGLMGLTVGCARCHDHKYDPIPIKDYYSLYGVFASSNEPDELPMLQPTPGGPDREAFEKEFKKLQGERDKFERDNAEMKKNRAREFREKLKPFENKIKKLKASHAGAPPHGMVMVDRAPPANPHVFLRGNPNNPGPVVPRQWLEVLAGPARKPFAKGSGRLEMAQAIASKDNPLTARVMVNRVWLHLFGAGLVRTPSDFGLRSEPPTHPELLDHLATRFVEEGWSTKKLIRSILLSKTYRQESEGVAEYGRVDPDNFLLWKMNRRRLDFEAMRDGTLAVAGRLDPAVGGRSVPLLTQPFSRRRTLYGFIDRQNLPGVYRTFDFASPDTHSPFRFTTTVPQQALFLMNSPFLVEQAKQVAARPGVAPRISASGRCTALCWAVRRPTPSATAPCASFMRRARTSRPRRD